MDFKNFEELENALPKDVREKADRKYKELLISYTLSQIREKRGLTQQELAKSLNINQSAISKFEKREAVTLSKLNDFVKALGGELEINITFPDETISPKPSYQQ